MRTPDELNTLNAAVPCQGRAWSEHMAKQLRKRWNLIIQEFNMYIVFCHGQSTLPGIDVTDVVRTISSIRLLFAAVRDTVIQFPQLDNDSSQQMVGVLRDVFLTLPRWAQDARPPGSSFAGGSQNYENNLLLRFATFENNWRHCVEVVGALGDKFPGHFKRCEKEWQSAEFRLRRALGTPQGQYQGNTGVFVRAFYKQLADIGGTFDRSREQYCAK